MEAHERFTLIQQYSENAFRRKYLSIFQSSNLGRKTLCEYISKQRDEIKIQSIKIKLELN